MVSLVPECTSGTIEFFPLLLIGAACQGSGVFEPLRSNVALSFVLNQLPDAISLQKDATRRFRLFLRLWNLEVARVQTASWV